MKFIRDIIAEKKRGPAVVESEENEAPVTLNDAGEPGPDGSQQNFDALPSLHDLKRSKDEPSHEAAESEEQETPDTYMDEKEPEYGEFSSADSFDLSDEDEAENRRQKLLDALAKDAAPEEDEDAGFIPDEPADVKIPGDEPTAADTAPQMPDLDLSAYTAPVADDEPQHEMEAAPAEVEQEAPEISEPEEAIEDMAASDDMDEMSDMSEPGSSVEDLIKGEMNGMAAPAAEAQPEVPGKDIEAASETATPETDTAPETAATEARVDAPEEPAADAVAETSVSIPKPTAGRTMGTSGRVKTRLLGFSGPGSASADPFAKKEEEAAEQTAPGYSSFPVGWLAVIDGPGRGAAFTIYNGVSQIGRGTDQTVRLDFGDNSISRENHAAIAYDAEQRKFYLGHGGKANLVRLNNRPVLTTEELGSDAQIRIGETVLRFVALCGSDFCWEQGEKGSVQDVARG